MPGLARKIIICAAVDGLVLHPFNSRKDHQQQQRLSPLAPVRIKYGDASISILPRDTVAPDPTSSQQPNASFEAFGIVGNAPRLLPPPFPSPTPTPSPTPKHTQRLITSNMM
jgi:hypothetical protein